MAASSASATLYHLAKKGWSDVVLIERKELTSGSTWHAAGLLPLFNMSYSVGQIHKYSVELYKSLEDETGQHVGFNKSRTFVSPAPRIAGTNSCITRASPTRSASMSRSSRLTQVKDIWPLCNMDGIIGAIQHPDDGYIQPADLTQALAKGARARGAEIYRNTTVTGIERTARRRMAGQDRQGRHHLRACRLGDRQLRAPDRRDGRARHPGHPGRASVHRHRAASGGAGAPRARACQRWGCCARAIRPGTCARRTAG